MRRRISDKAGRTDLPQSGLVEKLVEVLAAWSDLQRAEKRDLLHSFQIGIRTSRSRRPVLKVEQVAVGPL